jgi:hypothetical protein
MKVAIFTTVSLLIGLVTGCYVGYRYCEKRATNEAIQQMVEGAESSDALMAVTSARAIGFIDSGETQKAVEMLSRPIAHYYSIYATSPFTNERRLRLRAMTEELAKTNQTLAAQIEARESLR